jgi:hypothetical protein
MKTYYILINSGMGYDRPYEVHGVKKSFRQLGAVISRHRTLAAALKNRAFIEKHTLGPITTDVVTLHFWPSHDDYIGEEYCGANNFSYRPTSAL